MRFPINIFNLKKKKKRGHEKWNNTRGATAQNCLICRAVFSVILGISTNVFIFPKLYTQNFRGAERDLRIDV